MRGPHVVPGVGASLAERDDVLYRSGHAVREPQPSVNWFLADVANPVV